MILSLLFSSFLAIADLKNPFEINKTKWLVSGAMSSRLAFDASSLLDVSVMMSGKCGRNSAEGVRSFHLSVLNNQKSKQELMSDPCILGVGPHGKLSLHDADPMMKAQKHLETLGALEIADDLSMGYFKSKVILAVVDTGLDFSHPEFTALWTNDQEAQGSAGVDDDKNGYVDDIHGYDFVEKTGDPSHKTSNDHGSHVAGLAAANLGNGVGGAGIMGKNLQLMILNVVGSHWNEIDLNDVENAIRYAADKGADVINISSGGTGEYPTLAAAMIYAVNKGVTIVVSAGNGHTNIDETFNSPASYSKDIPGLISVGATDVASTQLCSFSNFGKSVKVTAPGCDTSAPKSGLLSTLRNATYGYMKGTSMAAPIVAGATALVYSYFRDRDKKLSPSEVENFLVSNSAEGLDLRHLKNKMVESK